jgi:hypothetical protein
VERGHGSKVFKRLDSLYRSAVIVPFRFGVVEPSLRSADAAQVDRFWGARPMYLQTMYSAIAIEEVAAGDGALRTVTTGPTWPIRKSSSSEPSG